MILRGLDNFRRGRREAEKQLVLQATETIRAVSLEAFQALSTDAKTVAGYGAPVASGRLAGSMRLGINQVDHSTAPHDPDYVYDRNNLRPRTIRNVSIAKIAAKLRTFKLGDKIYISNSVPYIRRIEIGRHSWQTPNGVFVPTMRHILAKFRNVKVRVFG